jgi:hypothetical protein
MSALTIQKFHHKNLANGKEIFFAPQGFGTSGRPLANFTMVSKAMGIDQVIDSIVTRLGDLERAYLIDDYAEGKDTGIVDLVLVGNIDQYHLNDLSRKTERYIKRKIRSLVLSKEEFHEFLPKLKEKPHVLIWEAKRE